MAHPSLPENLTHTVRIEWEIAVDTCGRGLDEERSSQSYVVLKTLLFEPISPSFLFLPRTLEATVT